MENRPSRRHTGRRRKPIRMPGWQIGLIDVLFIGLFLCIFSLYHHVLPRSYAVDISEEPGVEDPTEPSENNSGELDLGGYRFPGKFAIEAPIITDNRYVSQDVDVSVTQIQENGITYFVQDIYIRHIDSFRTAFAKNTYGKSINEWVLDMAKRNDAVCAINGDYYGIGSVGVVIRNGVLYRDDPDGDVLILYRDGVMKVYEPREFDGDQAMADGAWQGWCFGPSLLGENGEALTDIKSNIARANPRTAVGYFEPGHYCFITVDGRQTGYSDGISLDDLSRVFADLGCQVAYNMDGGQTAVMTFMDRLVNRPYDGGRQTSDILYIWDR